MIHYIRGRLTAREMDYIVVEAYGVGYRINTGNPFQFEEGEILVHTYHYVREDTMALYGFKTAVERDLFVKLLQVSGIGPKSALSIVSAVSPPQFARAIQQEDLAVLTQFPGVGRKTAQRLIVDLKDKLDHLLKETVWVEEKPEQERAHLPQEESNSVVEATSALEALGYSPQEISRLRPQLYKLADEGVGTQDLIKQGLRLLAKPSRQGQ